VTRYLLDTSFLIDYLRDDPIAVARFEQFFELADEIVVNEIVVCEARTGLAEAQVAEFEAMLEPAEFVQPGPQTALQAGRWRAESRRRGYVLSLADALVASAADASDAAVLTRNLRDFSLTPVRVESY
jgi:predicted nucleic acid-binding protein